MLVTFVFHTIYEQGMILLNMVRETAPPWSGAVVEAGWGRRAGGSGHRRPPEQEVFERGHEEHGGVNQAKKGGEIL